MAEMVEDVDKALALLGRKAGGKRARTAHDAAAVVRHGLPAGAVTGLARALDMPVSAVAGMVGIPPRTLARRRTGVLKPSESDRLYRVARVAALGIDVLGTIERTRAWLSRPSRALGGATPWSLLDTEIGAREVERVLGRLAYGVHG